MSKASYWQRGESLDYKNATETTIEANTVVKMAERIGIAGTDILPGAVGDLHMSGVFEFDKTSANAIPMERPYILTGPESQKQRMTARENRQHTLRRALRRQTQQQGTIRSS